MKVKGYIALLGVTLCCVAVGALPTVSASRLGQKLNSEAEWTASSILGTTGWIAHSEVTSGDWAHRVIFLFVEPQDFDPESLIGLFTGLQAEFKQPQDLAIYAYRNKFMLDKAIRDYLDPPGCYRADAAGIERMIKKMEEGLKVEDLDYHIAVYSRYEDEEEFYYYTAPTLRPSIRMTLNSRPSQFVHTGNDESDFVIAAREGLAQIVGSLLAKGVDIDARDGSGYTALMNAAAPGHADVVRLLLNRGAQVEAIDGGGATALMRAALAGQLAIAKQLLEKGADVEIKDRTLGGTALIYSVGSPEIVSLLLERGANANAQNDLGLSALMIAAFNGYATTIPLLLNGGADLNAKDRLGKTALTYAKERRSDDIAELLERLGAK